MSAVPAVPAELVSRLVSADEAAALIATGRHFALAADEAVLRGLPPGNWIAGTIPYFIDAAGGETSRERVFVSEIPVFGAAPRLLEYDVDSIARVCLDAPDNGFSLIILPAFSAIHSAFARHAPGFDNMYLSPLAGWVAGVHLDDLGKAKPLVANGQQARFSGENAVVAHVPLPPGMVAHLDIDNLYEQGDGDEIRFPETGFSAGDCAINGRSENLADYLVQQGIDTRLPLVADYQGAMINVSIEAVDAAGRRVDFYAPVFENVAYRVARPVSGARQGIDARPGVPGRLVFSCSCVLNYLYHGLEGRQAGALRGPVTFGEVAYQLLNQTSVFLGIERRG